MLRLHPTLISIILFILNKKPLKSNRMNYCVYILYSEKINKFYIGSSSNIESRFEFHNSSLNRIWTKRGQPWKLKRTIDCKDNSEALKLELKIKRMKSRKYIEEIVKNGIPL